MTAHLPSIRLIATFAAAATIALGTLTGILWAGARDDTDTGGGGPPTVSATPGPTTQAAEPGPTPTSDTTTSAAPTPTTTIPLPSPATVTVTVGPAARPAGEPTNWMALAALGTALGGLGTLAAGVAAVLSLRRTSGR